MSEIILTDEMLKEAFTQYAELWLASLPSEEELAGQWTPSPAFEMKMQKLFDKVGRRDRRRKLIKRFLHCLYRKDIYTP